MPACPKCNANVYIKFSSQVKCSACNSNLMAVFNPLGKAIAFFIILVESVAGIAIAVIAASTNYPFLQTWVIAGTLILGLIIITMLLLSWTMNKTASFHLK